MWRGRTDRWEAWGNGMGWDGMGTKNGPKQHSRDALTPRGHEENYLLVASCQLMSKAGNPRSMKAENRSAPHPLCIASLVQRILSAYASSAPGLLWAPAASSLSPSPAGSEACHAGLPYFTPSSILYTVKGVQSVPSVHPHSSGPGTMQRLHPTDE